MFPARRRDRPEINPVASPRAEWYDRNPADASQDYYGSLSPHVVTTRWSYTVPSGKKAWVQIATIFCMRRTAATTMGEVYVFLVIVPSGGSLKRLMIACFVDNTVWVKDKAYGGVGILLRAGDAVNANTADSSTGGTVDYYCGAKITEFDA